MCLYDKYVDVKRSRKVAVRVNLHKSNSWGHGQYFKKYISNVQPRTLKIIIFANFLAFEYFSNCGILSVSTHLIKPDVCIFCKSHKTLLNNFVIKATSLLARVLATGVINIYRDL